MTASHRGPSDPRSGDTFITSTGWRVVGMSPDKLIREPGPSRSEDLLGMDLGSDALFRTQCIVEPRDGKGKAVEVILEELSRVVDRSANERIRFVRDEPISIQASRFGGVEWDHLLEKGVWTGVLRWRYPHPAILGAALISRVYLEETKEFTRITVEVTTDEGLSSVRGHVGAGQARPDFLAALRNRLNFRYMGMEVRPHVLDTLDIEDFVRSRLSSRDRQTPSAVLAPLEAGGYAMDPEVLAGELLGLAHLFVLKDQTDTFRLTDAVGDRRLSCFWGAFRFYTPGFTTSDDPFEHPLLVPDRLLDPVMRAATLGQVAVSMATDPPWTMPGPLRAQTPAEEAIPEPEESEAEVVGPLPTYHPAEVVKPSIVTRSPPPTEGSAEVGAEGSRQIELASSSPALIRLGEQVGELAQAIHGLMATQMELMDEFRRLRTISTLRSAHTNALERRLGSLEGLLERYFRPDTTVTADTRELWADEAVQESEVADAEGLSLPGVVRQAMETHADTLLILESALTASEQSPYEDPDRVEATLGAMAEVASRRREGRLGTSLREAFREFGVDYRPNISENTSQRLREQYQFTDEHGRPVECVEHIAFGGTYDPRRCLRIYFSSRVPSETRFIIGHVGRHFEVATST